ncbi:MAG TPA: hypothetical protein VFZ55_02105 [Nitrososphaera sp.]
MAALSWSNKVLDITVLSGNSGIIIRGQNFDNTFIAEDGSATENLVQIVGSGIIEVTEVANDGRGDRDDDDDEEAEINFYNTDNQPYRRTLSDGDSIIVNS